MNRRIALDQLQVATPCHENWDGMSPSDGGKRFCDSCQKHVHDLSLYSRADAERLIAQSQGDHGVCVRMQRDSAGRLITLDYAAPPRAGRWRRWMPVAAAMAVASGLASLFAGGRAMANPGLPPGVMGGIPPYVEGEVPTTQPEVTMGDVAAPSTQPAKLGKVTPTGGETPATQPAEPLPPTMGLIAPPTPALPPDDASLRLTLTPAPTSGGPAYVIMGSVATPTAGQPIHGRVATPTTRPAPK